MNDGRQVCRVDNASNSDSTRHCSLKEISIQLKNEKLNCATDQGSESYENPPTSEFKEVEPTSWIARR